MLANRILESAVLNSYNQFCLIPYFCFSVVVAFSIFSALAQAVVKSNEIGEMEIGKPISETPWRFVIDFPVEFQEKRNIGCFLKRFSINVKKKW